MTRRYTIGAGQPGCLYDYGPERVDGKARAIECLLESICSELSKRTKARIRADLKRSGIHYFDRRLRPFIGHDYCEVSK